MFLQKRFRKLRKITIRMSFKIQSSIIKQNAVENFEHIHQYNIMINIEITKIVTFNEKISTLQKWNKFVHCEWNYWNAKKKQREKHRITTKFLTFDDCKFSHFNNLMRHRRKCFIFATLKFFHWELQFLLYQYLS